MKLAPIFQLATAPELAAAIRAAIEKFGGNGRAINEHNARAFAETVIKLMGGEGPHLYELETANFFNNTNPDEVRKLWEPVIEGRNGVWAKEVLRRYGYPPIDPRVYIPAPHTWLYDGDKHYDAENPNGVYNPWHLAFFQRQIREQKPIETTYQKQIERNQMRGIYEPPKL